MIDDAGTNASPPPDWTATSLHPCCPLCEYDLFGLLTPRCPECGYAFQWPEILDPRMAAHPYLFEYAVKSRLRSYLRTAIASFRPRAFWATLHPLQAPRVGRLVLYWFVSSLLLSLVFFIAEDVSAALILRLNAGRFGLPSASFLSLMGHYYTTSWWSREAILYLIPAISLPWLTWVVFLTFRISMRRARIGPAHVLRCVIYSLDPLQISPFLFVGTILPSLWFSFSRPNDDTIELRVLSPLLVLLAYRLAVAYRVYLRFDRPIATVMAAAIIVMLVLANVWYLCTLNLPW